MSEAQGTASGILLTTEQIQKRIAELGRQITDDYQGKSLHVVCVLESSFMFAADLVRQIKLPVSIQFVKPTQAETSEVIQIFYTPEVEVNGAEVLLVDVLVGSGLTTDFLLRNLYGRGAASVKLATLLDKRSERKLPLQPEYFGFLLDSSYVVGFGMGGEQHNLPHIASRPNGPQAV